MKKRSLLEWALPAFVLVVMGSACSGPANRVITNIEAGKDQATDGTASTMPPETFDPSPYAEERPPSRATIEHDAPESLLRGTAVKPPGSTQEGYRIQILSTRSKQQADQVFAQAVRWWAEGREQGRLGLLPPSEDGISPIYQEYNEPYWRVRIGDFVERDAAEELMPMVRAHFGNVFIAPAQIPAR